MIIKRPRFQVRITHEPTGIEVIRGDPQFKSERDAYNAGMKYIRSRLAMLGYAPSMLKVETINHSEEE